MSIAQYIETNKDVIHCFCALSSVFLTFVLVTVTYLAFRKIRSQHLIMQWSTLTSALYDLKKIQFEISILAEREKHEKAGIKIDEVKLKVTKDVELLQEKVADLDEQIE